MYMFVCTCTYMCEDIQMFVNVRARDIMCMTAYMYISMLHFHAT